MKQSYLNLIPTNGQKSFNGKAIIQRDGNTVTLLSYLTPVATYNTKTKEYTETSNPEYLTNTTKRHIKSFKKTFVDS